MKPVLLLVILALTFVMVPTVRGRETGFLETFGLAADRAKALSELIPGTRDYYYFHCLYAQNTGDLKAARGFLDRWIERHGRNEEIHVLENRQALLEYGRKSGPALEHIRNELGLTFSHRKEAGDTADAAETGFDPRRVGVSQLIQNFLKNQNDLGAFEDAGLDILPHDKLSPLQRRDLLRRLARPDIPNLAAMVVDDLSYPRSGGFGSHPIHRSLTLAQLEDCRRLMPALMDNQAFVETWIARLLPDDDQRPDVDPDVRLAYLERLWNFTSGLGTAFASLKMHALGYLLEADLDRGKLDRERFMAYIALPRERAYMNAKYLDTMRRNSAWAEASADFSGATGLIPLGDDEGLLREYLARFFLDPSLDNATADAIIAPFAPYLNDGWLRRILAETRLMAGRGDAEKWASLLPPEAYQEIRDRVEIRFDPANPESVRVDEAASLRMTVKNTGTLFVRIFEINSFNYYRVHGTEIDAGVALEGLTATWERTLSLEAPPVRRTDLTIELPELDHAGVFVVECIGGGKSSRAVIRKGGLYAADRVTPLGQAFRVFDETGEWRPTAVIWMKDREYSADEDGEILVPFSTAPEEKPLILRDGDRCSLARVFHQAEEYALTAGIHVPAESLVRGRTARILVRPSLTLNGWPVDADALEHPRLTIEAVDMDGISTTRTEEPSPNDWAPGGGNGPALAHEILVPDRLASLRVTLSAEVTLRSTGKKSPLSDGTVVTLNPGGDTAIRDVVPVPTKDGLVLEVRGKNGEAMPGVPVDMSFKYRWLRDAPTGTLVSDGDGRLNLGPLDGLEWLEIRSPDMPARRWTPPSDRCRYPAARQVLEGEVIRVPYVGPAPSSGRSRWSLLETRRGAYIADHGGRAVLRDGFLEITDLPPGRHELLVKDAATVLEIFVARGRKTEGMILAPGRALSADGEHPLHLRSVSADGRNLTVTLANATDDARVWIMASAFLPDRDIFGDQDVAAPVPVFRADLNPPGIHYLDMRDIGDEYRYILDRRFRDPVNGNLLRRPGLILNPWSVSKTDTGIQTAAPGQALPSVMDRAAMKRQRVAERRAAGDLVTAGSPVFDYLASPAKLLAAPAPDKNGRITIPLADLGGARYVQVLAMDSLQTVSRHVALSGGAPKLRDLRMTASGSGADKPMLEFRRVTAVPAGGRFSMADAPSSEYRLYDSLGVAWDLLETLNRVPDLEKFRFLRDWSSLDEAEKRKKASEFACHELHFFLWRKDRPFFDAVIKPHLANKMNKTFLDRWLLGEDVSAWRAPWEFSRLNMVEQILLLGRGENAGPYAKSLHDLLPPDPEGYDHRFETAMKGRALETPAAAGAGVTADSPIPLIAPQLAARAPSMDKNADGFAADMAEGAAMPSTLPESMPEMAKAPAPPRSSRKAKGAPVPPPLYRSPDKTEEWAESDYWHQAPGGSTAGLVTINGFWRDWAESDPNRPFVSARFTEATRGFTEILMALAVMDLPFQAAAHQRAITETPAGPEMTLTAASPMVVFHRELLPAEPAEDAGTVLAGQNFLRADDRYRYENNERLDKFVTGEYQTHVAYGCRAVVTNPSASPRQVEILTRIPDGAVPLGNGFFSKSRSARLEAYGTLAMEYSFYFPLAGEFRSQPTRVGANGRILASAAASTFTVTDHPPAPDTRSWAHVSQNGSHKEVLEFLRAEDPRRLDLDKIAFRMKDRDMFLKTIEILRERRIYQHTLWSYGLFHDVPDIIGDFLKHSPYAEHCGMAVSSPLLTLDPVIRGVYAHLEYHPLVNARAHRLGPTRQLLNDRFLAQYRRFLEKLAHQSALSPEDRLTAAVYLLLQDRVAEARVFFEGVTPQDTASQLQYDYLSLYLDVSAGKVDAAKATAQRHADYPVDHWRTRFRTALAQLDEAAGGRPPPAGIRIARRRSNPPWNWRNATAACSWPAGTSARPR